MHEEAPIEDFKRGLSNGVGTTYLFVRETPFTPDGL